MEISEISVGTPRTFYGTSSRCFSLYAIISKGISQTFLVYIYNSRMAIICRMKFSFGAGSGDLHCSLHVPGIQLRVDSNLNSK